MTALFGVRLCLDLIAAVLLVFGLSYWWLGDTPHEVAGVCLFALVLAHNVFNRRWYGRSARGRMGASRWFGLVATGVLALSMLVLTMTSAVIATAMPVWLPPDTDAAVRRLHGLAGYWAFVAVAIHLGMRWPMLMAVSRHAFGLVHQPRWRTTLLRLTTLAIVIEGIRSLVILGIPNRLIMRMSLIWWDFETDAWSFFGHCATAAGTFVAISYYVTRLFHSRYS